MAMGMRLQHPAFDAAAATAAMPACSPARRRRRDRTTSSTRASRSSPTTAATSSRICRQCGDPKCVDNCPAAALAKNGANGVIDWDGTKCVNCLLCTAGCAYGGIVYNARAGHVVKCDLCGGDPACVKACTSGALQYVTTARIYNEVGQLEDLFVPGLAGCQGCNTELVMRHTLRRIGPDTVLATPPGLHPGHGIGRLQRPDRNQGAGLSSAADQHRVDAGRRQAPLQAHRPRRERGGARGRRRRVRRRLPVALRRGRAQRADPVHLRGQRRLHEHRHAALQRARRTARGRRPRRSASAATARRRTRRTCR